MYTQCPDCRKSYPLTKKQARAKKAHIFCSDCKKKFTVTVILDEKITEIKTADKTKNSAIIEEPNSELTPTLLVEAKTIFIPKEETKSITELNVKDEYQPYLANVGGFLKKSDDKPAIVVPQAPEPASTPTPERLPWEAEQKSGNINWFAGVVFALLALLGQAIFFESGKLSQNTSYRPHLEKLCRLLGCQLKAYENLSELAVLQGSFTTLPDKTIAYKTVINNQSPFQQKLPNIQLNLLDYNEQLVAQRVFSPKDYLAEQPHAKLTIAPDETVEAKLLIAAPDTPVGGYNFNLVY